MNFLDLIYPNDIYCIACGRPLPTGTVLPLCEKCTSEILWVSGRLCGKCGKPLSENNPKELCHDCDCEKHYFDKGYSCALYHGHTADIIRDLKYRDKPGYCDAVATLMVARIKAEAGSTGELPAWDAIVPVPMYHVKKERRGYNQADLIARGLSKRLDIPFYANALTRNRDTGIMSSLSLGDRMQNLAGALCVAPCFRDKLRGKKILLVDDVYTTGSTADACAETMKALGCLSVDLITFAIGADARQKSAQDVVPDTELFYNSSDNLQLGL